MYWRNLLSALKTWIGIGQSSGNLGKNNDAHFEHQGKLQMDQECFQLLICIYLLYMCGWTCHWVLAEVKRQLAGVVLWVFQAWWPVPLTTESSLQSTEVPDFSVKKLGHIYLHKTYPKWGLSTLSHGEGRAQEALSLPEALWAGRDVFLSGTVLPSMSHSPISSPN